MKREERRRNEHSKQTPRQQQQCKCVFLTVVVTLPMDARRFLSQVPHRIVIEKHVNTHAHTETSLALSLSLPARITMCASVRACVITTAFGQNLFFLSCVDICFHSCHMFMAP